MKSGVLAKLAKRSATAWGLLLSCFSVPLFILPVNNSFLDNGKILKKESSVVMFVVKNMNLSLQRAHSG